MHCDRASSKLLPLHSEDLMDLGTKEVAEETPQTRLLDLKRNKQLDQANETIVTTQYSRKDVAAKQSTTYIQKQITLQLTKHGAPGLIDNI